MSIERLGLTTASALFVDGVWSAPNVVYSTDSSFHSLAGLSFVNNLPLLFTIEREAGINRMFAVSSNADDYWNNEQIRVPTSFSTNAVLDTSKGAEFSRWDNNFLTTLATGVTEPVAYGATPCGMLELDADGYLYCPKIIVGSVSIFPPNYVDSSSPELARSWGNFWEYFSFPSGVAVDDTRGRVYIADSLVADGGGNYMPVGRVQIWDRVNRTNNISYAWYGLANPLANFTVVICFIALWTEIQLVCRCCCR